MKIILLFFALFSVSSCLMLKTQSKDLETRGQVTTVPSSTNTTAPKNLIKQNLIENLINAPKLIHYGEDGAMDASVLKLYNIDTNGATNAPVKEVADIVSLREKAIPLLIEHLDDNRPSSATFHGGYVRSEQRVKVPVGHVCLDILLNIVDSSFYFDKKCETESRLEGCVKDGFYFRPDDYWIIGEVDNSREDNHYMERPIVRIVKKNWQKAYREGRLKYNFKVTWK